MLSRPEPLRGVATFEPIVERSLNQRSALSPWIPVVLWVALVFGLGSAGFQSDHTSRFLLPVLEWLLPDWKPWELRQLHLEIRKFAHAFEYGVTAILVFRAFTLSRSAWNVWRVAIGTWLLVLAVASVDELHQSTLKSRTGSVSDVLLDVAGGVLGIGIASQWIRRPEDQAGG